jgi:phosphate transport system substrate-binding protein
MKEFSKVLLVAGLLLGCASVMAEQPELKGSIAISGAWAIYPTAVAWAERFQQIHPKVKIDVSAGGAGKGAADAIAGLVDIGMVSRNPDPAELAKGIEALYILKDAVFSVVSEKNFFVRELQQTGIKKQFLNDLYITGMITTWEPIVGKKGNKQVHVYTRSDSCGAAASWAAFFKKKQEDLKGIGIYGDPGLLDTVKKDPLGIKLLPIDANENGKADAEEIFQNRQEAVDAIQKGTYPVIRKNFFFIKKGVNPLVKEFIRFALSDEGTKIVEAAGTSLPVLPQDRQAALKNLE